MLDNSLWKKPAFLSYAEEIIAWKIVFEGIKPSFNLGAYWLLYNLRKNNSQNAKHWSTKRIKEIFSIFSNSVLKIPALVYFHIKILS